MHLVGYHVPLRVELTLEVLFPDQSFSMPGLFVAKNT